MLELHRLCRDMGEPRSALRREADGLVGEIAAFLNRPSPETEELLAGWREEFRLCYGDAAASLSGNARLDADALLRAYGMAAGQDGQVLLFAIQTYFSLLVKCAMARILGKGRGGWGWAGVIRGEFARERGVSNYCAEDWFCWPAYERGFDRVMEAVDGQAARYEGGPGFAAPSGDDVKGLYEALIPGPLRHALGEYYTPDWLAAYTLGKGLSYCGGEVRRLRIADPTCGSGTFLLQAVAAKREAGCGLREILDTVYGFDINPLAVLTAKTNYLLAILDLLDGGEVELPVFRVDVLELEEPEASGPCRAAPPGPAEAVRRGQRDDLGKARRMGRADLAAGNPPWVNWEYLPRASRERSQRLWGEYGLVSAKGRSLSFLKEDVSVLITCVTANRLLRDGGTLAFVVRQGMFKSAQNGAGFRRFRLRDGRGLRALRVDDLSGIKAFGGAAASAAVLFARPGEETAYPVPYGLWERSGGGVFVREQQAVPASPQDPASPWLTAPAEELAGMGRLLGGNPYRARTGVFTGGANAVYWLKLRGAEGGLVTAANVVARAKRKAVQVEAELEAEYIYPMLKGGGVRPWRTRYDTYLLCPHTARTKLRPAPWEELSEQCPKTAAYLASFREVIDRRQGFAGWEKEIQRQAFHAVLRVGAYTFAPYKVVWKYIASQFVCAVIGRVDDPFLGEKLLLPNEKVMYVALEREEEAYYLCGVLSSTPVARCVRGYMNPTSISAHVLGRLRIPAYDPGNPLHREVARLCKEGHGQEDISPYIREIDGLIGRLYPVTNAIVSAVEKK